MNELLLMGLFRIFQEGVQHFEDLGELHAAKRLARGFGDMLPETFFLTGAN